MPDSGSKTLVVVCGPTAVGKTGLAIDLAEQLNTEILSADSRQVFKEIPIGTAQPSPAQLAAVKHHFVAERSITEPYNAGMFERDALARLDMLFKDHDHVVVCGGTGLYIKALCHGLDELPEADAEVRKMLEEKLRSQGIGHLRSLLERLDPDHFSKIDTQNPQRLMRALEVCITTGKPFSSFHRTAKAERPFSIIRIGLGMDRKLLNERIDQRASEMIAAGWLKEAESVFEHRHLNALNTVGYKDLFAYLEGKISLDEAVEKIKISTRQYAKRQMTWFRKDEYIKWITEPDAASVMGIIQD